MSVVRKHYLGSITAKGLLLNFLPWQRLGGLPCPRANTLDTSASGKDSKRLLLVVMVPWVGKVAGYRQSACGLWFAKGTTEDQERRRAKQDPLPSHPCLATAQQRHHRQRRAECWTQTTLGQCVTMLGNQLVLWLSWP